MGEPAFLSEEVPVWEVAGGGGKEDGKLVLDGYRVSAMVNKI